jgi:hypothetical protein
MLPMYFPKPHWQRRSSHFRPGAALAAQSRRTGMIVVTLRNAASSTSLMRSAREVHMKNGPMITFSASSAEFVGQFRLGQMAKLVI